MPSPVLDQDKNEKQMIDLGYTNYWNRVTKAVEKKREETTGYGQRLIAGAVQRCADAISLWRSEAEAKTAGRNHSAYRFVKMVPPDVAAFLVSREVIRAISSNLLYTSACVRAGRAMEDEVRFSWLKANHPGLFRKLEKQLSTSSSTEHKRTVVILAMNRSRLKIEEWGDANKAVVGAVLIDLFQRSTDLVEIVEEGRAEGNSKKRVRATAKTLEWIRTFNVNNELLEPVALPCVEPPQPWTTPHYASGGYRDTNLLAMALVKRKSYDYLERIAKAEMPDVYECVNALQATAWKVNTRVLDVLTEFSNSAVAIGSMPAAVEELLPPKPADIETNEETRKVWRTAAHAVHERNATSNAHRVALKGLRFVAEKFALNERIYFPYQLDFRGRIYAVPDYLNPQGSDLSKSLLLFADGVPVMDDMDAEWLKIAGANLYGVDKVSFEGRKQWVDDHREDILRVADDPCNYTWWTKADGGDSAWCFLAWCFEWAGWLRTGPGFITHLPCNIDGTNNGLQILSMLTRDEIAARATNVTPGATPQDIYGDVAKRALALMREDSAFVPKPDMPTLEQVAAQLEMAPERVAAILKGKSRFEEDGEDKSVPPAILKKVKTTAKDMGFDWDYAERIAHANYWLAFGIDRKTCKRPVMVLPYGGSFQSCKDYLMDWYKETLTKRGLPAPDKKESFKRILYLADTVWAAIAGIVCRPRECMAWLQQIASLCNEHNIPIRWTTPLGFVVEQAYRAEDMVRVKTTLGDSCQPVKVRINITEARPKKLDKRRQRNGISPNFVHSLDAAALMETVSFCSRGGIKSFAMIHDSYGTHSPRMHELAAACRMSFAALFEPDLLNKLRDEVLAALPAGTAVPPVPTYGSLNVSSVMESDFFFA